MITTVEWVGLRQLELRTRDGELAYRKQLRLQMRQAGQIVRKHWRRQIRIAFSGGESTGAFARSIKIKLKWNPQQTLYDMRIKAGGAYFRGTKRHGPRSRASLPHAYSGIFEAGGAIYRRGRTLQSTWEPGRIKAWATQSAIWGGGRRFTALRGKPHWAMYRRRPTLGPAMRLSQSQVIERLGVPLQYIWGRRVA